MVRWSVAAPYDENSVSRGCSVCGHAIHVVFDLNWRGILVPSKLFVEMLEAVTEAAEVYMCIRASGRGRSAHAAFMNSYGPRRKVSNKRPRVHEHCPWLLENVHLLPRVIARRAGNLSNVCRDEISSSWEQSKHFKGWWSTCSYGLDATEFTANPSKPRRFSQQSHTPVAEEQQSRCTIM